MAHTVSILLNLSPHLPLPADNTRLLSGLISTAVGTESMPKHAVWATEMAGRWPPKSWVSHLLPRRCPSALLQSGLDFVMPNPSANAFLLGSILCHTEGVRKKKSSSYKSIFFPLDQCIRLHLTSVGALSEIKSSKWPNGKNNNAIICT